MLNFTLKLPVLRIICRSMLSVARPPIGNIDETDGPSVGIITSEETQKGIWADAVALCFSILVRNRIDPVIQADGC